MRGHIVPGGWDCHAHVFGPYEQYPLSEPRVHTPPPAPIADYLAHIDRLGLNHGVLVHPSAYGTNHSLLFDTLADRPQLRGVIVPTPGAAPAFDGLHERGVRGARFSHRSAGNFPGAPGIDDLIRLAPALAGAGLHAELWTDCAALPALQETLSNLPIPVVLDHMGGFSVDAGVSDPGFGVMLELLRQGSVWVKLCAYRNLIGVTDADAGGVFHRALVEANPRHLVWGSDWPYLRVSPVPDGLELLNSMRRWVDDPDVVQQILVANPMALYG